MPREALSHGGAIETGEGPKGPVTLTTAQIKALGLQTAQADFRPMESLLRVHGEVSPLPEAQSNVTLRFSGIVKAIYAKLGDVVHKGDRLALVESRVVGDPPPTIVVTAPMAGTIDARNIIVGQSVEPDSVLFHLSDLAKLRAVGRVYEEDLGKVHVGQAAHVNVLAFPAEPFSGTLIYVGPALDPDTRTAEIAVSLDNGKGLLKPNLFTRIDLVIGKTDAALTIPNNAILEAGGEKFVFVRDGGTFTRSDIEVGASDDQYTEVTSGIVPGDEVVTVGAREVYTQWLTGGAMKAEE
ncbi:MAG: efflux RND transporter periplasmic adaptor subunit [Alphaproteobacteria bacterium]|nr:efflux RND transporter periplasmic adaptor subunit [Alphaproteobacteria bacterium]